MSVDAYHQSINSQADTAKTTLDADIASLKDMLAEAQKVVNATPELEGNAYQSAKDYYSSMIIPLIEGSIVYSTSLKTDLVRIKDYETEVAAMTLKQSELEADIAAYDAQIQELEDSISNLKFLALVTPIVAIVMKTMYSDQLENIQKERESVQKLLDKLLAFDLVTAGLFADLPTLQEALQTGMAQIGTVWNAEEGKYKIPDTTQLAWTGTIATEKKEYFEAEARRQYEEYLKEHPEDIETVITIVEYETMESDYAEQVNEFLSPLEQQDIVGIKYLMYTAEEPYRTMSMMYLDQMTLVDVAEGGSFSPNNKTIKFDAEEDRTDPRGRYYTFFHEIGHAIDFYSASPDQQAQGIFYSDVYQHEGVTLSQKNIQDVTNAIRNKAMEVVNTDEKYKYLSQTEKNQLIEQAVENLLNPKLSRNSIEPHSLESRLNQEFVPELANPDNESASDIYGGVTVNKINGGAKGYTHKDSYWVDANGEIINETNKESFAEFYGRQMTDENAQENGLQSIQKHLPGSYVYLERMFKEIGER